VAVAGPDPDADVFSICASVPCGVAETSYCCSLNAIGVGCAEVAIGTPVPVDSLVVEGLDELDVGVMAVVFSAVEGSGVVAAVVVVVDSASLVVDSVVPTASAVEPIVVVVVAAVVVETARVVALVGCGVAMEVVGACVVAASVVEELGAKEAPCSMLICPLRLFTSYVSATGLRVLISPLWSAISS